MLKIITFFRDLAKFDEDQRDSDKKDKSHKKYDEKHSSYNKSDNKNYPPKDLNRDELRHRLNKNSSAEDEKSNKRTDHSTKPKKDTLP